MFGTTVLENLRVARGDLTAAEATDVLARVGLGGVARRAPRRARHRRRPGRPHGVRRRTTPAARRARPGVTRPRCCSSTSPPSTSTRNARTPWSRTCWTTRAGSSSSPTGSARWRRPTRSSCSTPDASARAARTPSSWRPSRTTVTRGSESARPTDGRPDRGRADACRSRRRSRTTTWSAPSSRSPASSSCPRCSSGSSRSPPASPEPRTARSPCSTSAGCPPPSCPPACRATVAEVLRTAPHRARRARRGPRDRRAAPATTLREHPAFRGIPPDHPSDGPVPRDLRPGRRPRLRPAVPVREGRRLHRRRTRTSWSSLAAAAGAAVANAQLYADAQRREHWLRAGQDLTTMLLEGVDEDGRARTHRRRPPGTPTRRTPPRSRCPGSAASWSSRSRSAASATSCSARRCLRAPARGR